MDCVEDFAKVVSGALSERKKVIVPTFVDDSLYAILYYLRIEKSLSAPFWIASFAYTQLMDILASVCVGDNFISISSAEALQLEQTRLVGWSLFGSVIFAPYPVGEREFGQIIALKQKHADASTHFQTIYGDAPGTIPAGVLSSGPSKLARFVQELKPKAVFGPPELALDWRQLYPARIAVSDSLVRWLELGSLRKAERTLGGLRLIAGELEGERALPMPIARQCIANAPHIEELARLLREQGATNLRHDDATLRCKFSFVGGDDCSASIEFGDVITITTGSARIENVVSEAIGALFSYTM
jgi:hypothetical protein